MGNRARLRACKYIEISVDFVEKGDVLNVKEMDKLCQKKMELKMAEKDRWFNTFDEFVKKLPCPGLAYC